MNPEVESMMYKAIYTTTLASILRQIKAADTDYEVRNPLVIQALSLAQALEYSSGIKIDSNEPQWPVVYVDLPTGQVSWHLPEYTGEWDKHTTSEKFNRIDAFFTMVSEELGAATHEIAVDIESKMTQDDL